MDTKPARINILDKKMLGSVIVILTTLLIIFLMYNEKTKLKTNDSILNDKESSKLLITNRIIIILVLIFFIYTNYQVRELDKIDGKDLKPDNLEILAGVLALASAIVIIYTAWRYPERIETEIEMDTPEASEP